MKELTLSILKNKKILNSDHPNISYEPCNILAGDDVYTLCSVNVVMKRGTKEGEDVPIVIATVRMIQNHVGVVGKVYVCVCVCV